MGTNRAAMANNIEMKSESSKVEQVIKNKTTKKIMKSDKEKLWKEWNTQTFLKTIPINELKEGGSYCIKNVERITTKYAESIITQIIKNGDNLKYFYQDIIKIKCPISK